MLDIKELEVEYITNQAGDKKAVILSIGIFQELIEDMQDLAIIAERRAEPTVSHDALLVELKRDGLI